MTPVAEQMVVCAGGHHGLLECTSPIDDVDVAESVKVVGIIEDGRIALES